MNDTQPTGIEALRAPSESITKMTPLELNSIKLDAKHTLLTPEYLEQLIKSDKPLTNN